MKSIIAVLPLLFVIQVFAQKVETQKNSRDINGQKAEGYSVTVTGSVERVRPALQKYLRDYGKLKQNLGYTSVQNPALGGNTYDKKSIYAVTEGSVSTAQIWVGLIDSEWQDGDTDVLKERIKEMTYQFAVKFYRDQVQLEINETQQAADATDRKVEKLISENKDLNVKLLANEQEKLKLEKALELNKAAHELLLQKIDGNKKAQDSVTNAGLQIKKILEGQKDRQSKIN
jgi:hypothetical protein